MDDRRVTRACLMVVVTIVMTWLAAPPTDAPAVYPTLADRPAMRLSPTIAVPTLDSLQDLGFIENISPLDTEPSEDAAGEVDLFGNDIMTAVATYKVDNAGSVYELHSPHTEVPRLGVPKS